MFMLLPDLMTLWIVMILAMATTMSRIWDST